MSQKNNVNVDQSMNFEDALASLEEIVGKLESGQIPLADSIENYEKGVALKNICEERLKEAQEKIEKITINADGSVSTEPLDKE